MIEECKPAIGKRIVKIVLQRDSGKPDFFQLDFEDGTGLRFWDSGQNCCEYRYMNCDDDLALFVAMQATFLGAELADAPEREVDGDCLETQFLRIQTSYGVLTVANYNQHNGYYGGFELEIAYRKKDEISWGQAERC